MNHAALRGWAPLVAAAAVYGGVLVTVAALRADSSSDFRDFWENAVHFRQTGEIAADLGVHNYLPFFTLFMLPWGLLPLPVAAAVFTVFSLALFALTVVIVEHLLHDGWSQRPRGTLLLTLLLALPYVHSCAVVGSVSLLLLFLIMAAWLLVERGREWQAGAALGLAILIKLLPAALLVFFLLKRRWRVGGAAAAVVALLGLGLPLLALGPGETLAQHRAFLDRAVRGGSAVETLTATQPVKTHFSNNALPMVLRRLLSPTNAGRWSAREEFYVNFADLPARARVWVYAGLAGLLLAASVVITLWRGRRWPPADAAEGYVLRAQFGSWCCLMLLLSPLVWTHYLPLAYWPLAWLTDEAHRATRRRLVVCVLALALWGLAAVLLAWPPGRAAGAQLAGVIALWLALACCNGVRMGTAKR
jgi:hypothetical protein